MAEVLMLQRKGGTTHTVVGQPPMESVPLSPNIAHIRSRKMQKTLAKCCFRDQPCSFWYFPPVLELGSVVGRIFCSRRSLCHFPPCARTWLGGWEDLLLPSFSVPLPPM